MPSKTRGKSKRLSGPTTKQTPEVASSAEANTPSLLKNAKNTHISGGSFNITTTLNTANESSLNILHKRVAPNAILNAGGRADEVRCHPGTREEVIDRIENWSDAQDGQTAPIFWLSGPAGAGKSAIMQTIAERRKQHGAPHANFFFFRADTSRSHASPLIATLLHQIILIYPSLRESVANVLSANPLIFDSVLIDQLRQLVVMPIRSIQQSSTDYRPLILLIDGLDECDSKAKRIQQQLLDAFDKVLIEYPCPFRLLVASRDESHIRSAFNKLSSQCLHLYLDNQYSPESDIRVFVNAQFEQIRRTHPLAHTLDATWPSMEDVSYIIYKSSGQFIYAATVMRFLSDSAASPMLSLERVQGAAQFATKSPFSHLDAIYSYILSQADDQEALKDILRAQVLIREDQEGKDRKPRPPIFGPTTAPPAPSLFAFASTSGSNPRLFGSASAPPAQPTSPTVPLLMELLKLLHNRYTQATIISCLEDITSIARYDVKTSQLLFYHASFSDYLLDESRSGQYFVDIRASGYRTLPHVWNLIENGERDQRWLWFAIFGTSKLQKLPPGLMSIMASAKYVWPRFRAGHTSYFKAFSQLCVCDDDIVNFRSILRQWIAGDELDNFKKHLDDLKKIPFARRYYEMARGDCYYSPDSEMGAALRSKTDSDRQELSLWLGELLHRAHRAKDDYSPEIFFKRLLKNWIYWAVDNDIPCDNLTDLPDARRYIRRGIARKGPAQGSRIARGKK